MVFNVTLGFNQLENPSAEDDRGRVYALLIGDTVLVNKVCIVQYNIGVIYEVLTLISSHFLQDGPATELCICSVYLFVL